MHTVWLSAVCLTKKLSQNWEQHQCGSLALRETLVVTQTAFHIKRSQFPLLLECRFQSIFSAGNVTVLLLIALEKKKKKETQLSLPHRPQWLNSSSIYFTKKDPTLGGSWCSQKCWQETVDAWCFLLFTATNVSAKQSSSFCFCLLTVHIFFFKWWDRQKLNGCPCFWWYFHPDSDAVRCGEINNISLSYWGKKASCIETKCGVKQLMNILWNWPPYEDLKHRCQSLAHGPNLSRTVPIIDLQGNTKSLREAACCSETAHVKLQMPECAAQLGPNIDWQILLWLHRYVVFIFRFIMSPW